jgi:hypothetical protein
MYKKKIFIRHFPVKEQSGFKTTTVQSSHCFNVILYQIIIHKVSYGNKDFEVHIENMFRN